MLQVWEKGTQGFILLLMKLFWTFEIFQHKLTEIKINTYNGTWNFPLFKWQASLVSCFLAQTCNFPSYYAHGLYNMNLKVACLGVPGWLSRLSVRLRLRSRYHDPWVRAPRRALGWWLRAWSLLPILCLPLSVPLPHSCFVSLCLKNK